MTESRDMDAPVTRRELLDVLDIWGNTFEQRIERRITENIMTGVRALFEALDVRLVNMEARLRADLGTQARGSLDRVSDRIGAIDDKYGELPARVTRLEAKVFPPKKPRRRRAG